MNVPQRYITRALLILFVYLITDYLRTLPTVHIICAECYSDHCMHQQELKVAMTSFYGLLQCLPGQTEENY